MQSSTRFEQPTSPDSRVHYRQTLFRGPVKHGNRFYPHTYKFTVNCGAALRPLACKGPIDDNDEWTLLLPVIEVGRQYPNGCFAEAERRRLEIIEDPSRRREILSNDDE